MTRIAAIVVDGLWIELGAQAAEHASLGAAQPQALIRRPQRRAGEAAESPRTLSPKGNSEVTVTSLDRRPWGGPVVPPAELDGCDVKVRPLRKLCSDQPSHQ